MQETMDQTIDKFITGRREFLTFLKEWDAQLPVVEIHRIVEEAGGPENVGVVCTDVTVAFASKGRLASPRIAGIVEPIANLFRLAHSCGVTNFALPQDAHPADSPEFDAYGPHSIVGSEGAQTMPQLTSLPFADQFIVLPKQSINPAVDTGYPDWLESHGNICRFIVVGDVTDICVYQIAVHLQARKSQFKLGYEVIVPEDCVNTWDTSAESARTAGILPHDGDLLHLVFLYHMQLNAIQVVRSII